MKSVLRKAPGAGERTGRKLIASAHYAPLALLANIFGAPRFGFLNAAVRSLRIASNKKGARSE
jgi:hypothetical protein